MADLEERFASRKAVDQAKGLLQEGLGLSEAEVLPLDSEDRHGSAQVDA